MVFIFFGHQTFFIHWIRFRFNLSTMSKNKVTSYTRQKTEHFLVGQEQADLGKEAMSGKLPLTRDVMKYLFHVKNLPEFKYKPVGGVICCPLKSISVISSCEDASCFCVVSRGKYEGRWLESGIPIISDRSIRDKLVRLNDDFKKLDKNKKNLIVINKRE